jgi:hypothetical protein
MQYSAKDTGTYLSKSQRSATRARGRCGGAPSPPAGGGGSCPRRATGAPVSADVTYGCSMRAYMKKAATANQ